MHRGDLRRSLLTGKLIPPTTLIAVTPFHTARPLPSLPLSPESLISKLVLSHDGPTQTLSEALRSVDVQWTPSLVDAVLKRLWNHGPKALLFFRSLEYLHDYTHSPSSFDLAVDLSARLQDHKLMWALLSRMRRLRLLPSPRTFAIISERLAAAGKPHRAVRAFLSMHHHGCPQTLPSFNALLDILCKSRRVEMAYSLFKTFKRRFPPDVITYNTIANGWCIVKQPSKAMEILREMVDVDINPTTATYNLLLHGFFHAGQVKNGYKFFVQMKERGGDSKPDVVTYTTVIHALGVAGDVWKAKRVFETMIGEGCLPSVVTYNALIQVICKKDDVENAVKMFDEMVRKGYAANVTTYNVIIRGLCHVGKFDRAMEYVEKMKSKEECVMPNVQTFNILIRYLCEAGDSEKGSEVFRKMGDEGCLPNLDTYNVLISGFFETGKPEWILEAGKLLVEMVERGFLPRKFMFNRVLNGLLMTGHQAFAKEILSMQSSTGRLSRRIRL